MFTSSTASGRYRVGSSVVGALVAGSIGFATPAQAITPAYSVSGTATVLQTGDQVTEGLVSLSDPDGTTTNLGINQDGSFAFPDLTQPGTYNLTIRSCPSSPCIGQQRLIDVTADQPAALVAMQLSEDIAGEDAGISGNANVGETLSATPHFSPSTYTVDSHFNWYRYAPGSEEGDYAGDGPSYTLTRADRGYQMRALGSVSSLDGYGQAMSFTPLSDTVGARLGASFIISGHVSDPAGDAAPATDVSLYDGTTPASAEETTEPLDYATADADGAYSFTNLAPGTYRLRFRYINANQDLLEQVRTVVAEGGEGEQTLTADGHVNAFQGDVLPMTGTARAGSILTAGTPTFTPADAAYTDGAWQWFRRGATDDEATAIPGATSATYALTAAEVGTYVHAEFSATSSDGWGSARVFSDESDKVLPVVVAPKTFTAIPRVTGTPKVARVLRVSVGSVPSATSLRYQWLRNGHSISGARSASYQAVKADAGTRLSVKVTYAKSSYTTLTRTSAPTSRVAR